MNPEQIKIEPRWKAALLHEFKKPYMLELKTFLQVEARAGKTIYPKGCDIFNALNLTPFDQVKVVILGQDPYHGPGQAHGLCFSVKEGVRLPPSLQNIFKEISKELGIPAPKSGDLSGWAKQGVLLLNAVLTVEEGKAASHQGRGWEKFTDEIIRVLSEREDPVIFLLWGNFAQSKMPMIRVPPHFVLRCAHPSPLSAHNGFFGCGHFSKTNEILRSLGKKEIEWGKL